jgi:hypothetical protein
MNCRRMVTKDSLRTAAPAGHDFSGWWVEPLPTQGGDVLAGAPLASAVPGGAC